MKTTNADLAREFITRFKNHSQRAIGKALYAAHPLRFTPKGAYSMVQNVSSAWGGKNKSVQSKDYIPKKVSVPVPAPPPIPPSMVKPWVPYELTGKRILVLSDIHAPYHDCASLNAALDYGDTYNPDVVLLNGDVCDFYTISRYETNPEMRDLAGEVKAVRDLLGHIRARFPKARLIFKLGNHDERWWSYLWRKAPELLGLELADFGELVHARQHRVEIVGEQRIIQCGHLSILHGHELPKGMTNPVNPARGVFLRAVDIALIGHQHRSSEHTETTMMGRTITCWSTGCLCDLHPEYARINRWNHGFATVDMTGNDFRVNNMRIRNGKIL